MPNWFPITNFYCTAYNIFFVCRFTIFYFVDKESVKQDEDSKSSCITSSYLLVPLTVLLTFRCIYYS